MKSLSELLQEGSQAQQQGRLKEAVRIYRQILKFRPDNTNILDLLGTVRLQQERYEDAAELFTKSIRLAPEMPESHYRLGMALVPLQRFDQAAPCFLRAYKLKPELPHALDEYARIRRLACDWGDYEWLERELIATVRQRNVAVSPHTFQQFCDDPADQLVCATTQALRDRIPPWLVRKPQRPPRDAHDKIRLGYLSADFRDHAVTHLLADLIERHDRSRFEVIAISLGPNDKSAARTRIARAFDQFIDLFELPDEAVAKRVRDLQIDILVDLMGHTANNHMAVLAYGPAPIQVNYLGFPGSIGADCVDYAIVDPFVAPPDMARNFTERLVYLPDCYQPNDPARRIGDRTPSRRECKLPDESFVFCSFNNNLKFTPAVFDIWMRLLAQLPGAVFWLYVDNKVAISNLRKEAEARGIDPNRLVFAAKLPLADHLARHRLADLFLDTLPYGGHTTASDALWAGLPLVTCLGRSFPSRVAGSLLRAVGLPELVTENLEAYEKLALALATEPQRLSEIRRRLAHNRLSAPLFDGERYRLHIEAAYSEMFEIWRRGEKPRPIKVEPIPG